MPFDEISYNISEYLSEDFESAIIHGMCVSKLASEIGKELGLEQEILDNLAIAGMLHDIGKLKISSFVYGRSENTMAIEEIGYVRKHPTLGYAIVKKQGYSDEISEMILYHHENYDGSGYPANLVGNQIPLEARILRVSDVFCALISNRPYRKGFDIETAAVLMIDEVQHFDMKIFLAFQRVIHSDEVIHELLEIINEVFEIDKEEE